MVKVTDQMLGKNLRKSFSKTRTTLEIPNLIEIQTKSFKWFLEEGLMEVLRDVSPIVDFSGNLSIEFISFSIDSKPKYPVEECKERDVNYGNLSAALKLYDEAVMDLETVNPKPADYSELKALKEKRLAGAYLDVFKNEPTVLNAGRRRAPGVLAEGKNLPGNLIRMPHASAFSPSYIKMCFKELKDEGLI